VYAYLFGNFVFNSTPLTPHSTKVIAHIKPERRGSWDLNDESGWYVGPTDKHYQCVTCYFSKTKVERVCDTVTFITHVIPFPKVKLSDHLRQTATVMVHFLTSLPSNTVPCLEGGNPTRTLLSPNFKILRINQNYLNYSHLKSSILCHFRG